MVTEPPSRLPGRDSGCRALLTWSPNSPLEAGPRESKSPDSPSREVVGRNVIPTMAFGTLCHRIRVLGISGSSMAPNNANSVPPLPHAGPPTTHGPPNPVPT